MKPNEEVLKQIEKLENFKSNYVKSKPARDNLETNYKTRRKVDTFIVGLNLYLRPGKYWGFRNRFSIKDLRFDTNIFNWEKALQGFKDNQETHMQKHNNTYMLISLNACLFNWNEDNLSDRCISNVLN